MSKPPLTGRNIQRGQSRFKGSAAARLVPHTRFGGPAPWVIAILIALVVVAAAGGLALQNLANNARADLSGAVTVQIIEAEPETRSELALEAARLLGDQPNVSTVRIIPEDELSEMLEPWLGGGSNDLPIPALIDVQLTGSASPAQIAALEVALAPDVPNTRVDAQSDWLQPVYSALASLQYLALALILLVAFACAASVWLAARNSLANHRNTIEIIHLLGGTDRQVTRVFQRTVLRDAAIGGFAGLALGALAVLLIGQQFAALDSGMVAGVGFGWIDFAILAAVPIGGIILAYITGRLTITAALRSML